MRNVVQPLDVGATGSMVISFTEPLPGKYRQPFSVRSLLAPAGIIALAVIAGYVAVRGLVIGDVAAVWFGSITAPLLVLSSFQCYVNGAEDRRGEYITNVFIPFVRREVVIPVENWLQDNGMIGYEGEPPRIAWDFAGVTLYNAFYSKNVRDAGAWMRSYRIDADGEPVDSGKAYTVSILPEGKGAVKVSFEVLDNSEDM